MTDTIKPKYPRLVGGDGCGRWGPPTLGSVPIPGALEYGSPDHQRLCIADMCDYGAKAFYAEKCDCLAFDCMPGEVEQIKAYMAEKHPTVNYAFGSSRKVLGCAQAEWVSKYGKPTVDDIAKS